MDGIRVISAADAPRGSHAHNFQLTVAQKCVLVKKIPGFTPIS